MLAKTIRDLVFGNPGETRLLPAGIRVRIKPALNLPKGDYLQWWAFPPYASRPAWPSDTANWATRGPGCLVTSEDLDFGTSA